MPHQIAKITLDGTLKSDLKWNASIEAAQKEIAEGKKILWELELGLFRNLPFPLSNQSQYLSLGLSIEHFRDAIWKDFPDQTEGLCIYRGSADFSLGFPWGELQTANLRGWLRDVFETSDQFTAEIGIAADSFEQLDERSLRQNREGAQLLRLFCRDACSEYLELLTNRLPDALQLFLEVDASTLPGKLCQAQLLSKERFDRFHLLIARNLLPAREGAISVGVCLPQVAMSRPSQYEGLDAAMEILSRKKIAYKVIPEPHIITEWDGLDYLIVSPAGLTTQGLRKLQGFCAAGGTVVSLGKPVGVALETTFQEFLKG